MERKDRRKKRLNKMDGGLDLLKFSLVPETWSISHLNLHVNFNMEKTKYERRLVLVTTYLHVILISSWFRS